MASIDTTEVCISCDALTDYAPDFNLNGITSVECGNLQQNNGLTNAPYHDNYSDIVDILQCRIAGLLLLIEQTDNCNWKDVARATATSLFDALSAINCGDLGQWEKINDIIIRLTELENIVNGKLSDLEKKLQDQIDDINERLTDLEEVVRALNGSIQYTYLRPGVDYTTQFHNGFYNANNNVRIGFAETSSQVLLEFDSPSIDGWRIGNDGYKSNNVQMAHANPNNAQSWIYTVNFLGDYARLNTYTFRSTTLGETGIWNLTPVTNRTRYPAYCQLYKNINGSNNRLTCIWESYGDGYNSQLTAYPDTEFTGVINLTLTCVLLKPNSR